MAFVVHDYYAAAGRTRLDHLVTLCLLLLELYFLLYQVAQDKPLNHVEDNSGEHSEEMIKIIIQNIRKKIIWTTD